MIEKASCEGGVFQLLCIKRCKTLFKQNLKFKNAPSELGEATEIRALKSGNSFDV